MPWKPTGQESLSARRGIEIGGNTAAPHYLADQDKKNLRRELGVLRADAAHISGPAHRSLRVMPIE